MTKYLLALFGVSTLLLSSQSCAQGNRTIAFYNVENLFDTVDTPEKDDAEFLPNSERQWNSERYTEKLAHINTVIDLLNEPLLLGLCEIENEAVVRDVVNHGKMKGQYGVVHIESLDMRGIDNVLIYDSSALTLNSSGVVRFDMPEGSRPSRDILWAKFVSGGDTILAMVNHWPSRYGGQVKSEPKRLIAAVAAKTFIDSVMTSSPDVQIVFMGDLNDHPDNRAPQMISASLKPQITARSGEFGGTHNYRGDWGILDHIMVSPNFLKKKGIYVKKKSGKIYSPKFLLDTYKGNIVPFRTYGGRKYLGGYSDHLPVSISIGM